MTTLCELTDDTRIDWDAYVRSAPEGLPTHLSGWRDVLRKTGGYETRYLMARQDGRVVGVLPLFFVRSALVGKSAMTMPGGLCADSNEIAVSLIHEGQSIARLAGMRRFVVQDGRQEWPAGLMHAFRPRSLGGRRARRCGGSMEPPGPQSAPPGAYGNSQ